MPFKALGQGAGGAGGAAEGVVEGAAGGQPLRKDGKMGCTHYARKCKLVAPCCGEVFWCRHCHNEKHNDQERDPKKAHQMDRTKVTEVVCACCSDRQPVSGCCRSCGQTFGAYFCLPCRFYDDDTSKGQFHCDGCGICRVGGRENYFHCSTCVACLPLSMQGAHKCIQESLRVNCPVCLEFLMDSLKTASILKCGHAIHSSCQKALLKSGNPRCPICNASFLDMEEHWKMLDQEISLTPMPRELRDWKVEILCADCHATTQCNFHFEGLKCGSCGGYNTTRCGNEQPPMMEAGVTEQAHEDAAASEGAGAESHMAMFPDAQVLRETVAAMEMAAARARADARRARAEARAMGQPFGDGPDDSDDSLDSEEEEGDDDEEEEGDEEEHSDDNVLNVQQADSEVDNAGAGVDAPGGTSHNAGRDSLQEERSSSEGPCRAREAP